MPPRHVGVDPPPVARRGAIPPFIVMDVLRAANDRAEAGGDVLHLEVGQPGTGAPAPVLEAARVALAADRLGYTDALGLSTLRRRIAQHYGETYGFDLDWRRVVVTAGSSGAFILAFLAAFESGNRVALASPGYPAYRNILSALGVTVVDLPVAAATDFQPTPDDLDRAAAGGALSGLIVASPANPTGTMLSRSRLDDLAKWCGGHSAWFVSDEIYHGITYGTPAETALTLDPDAIAINSFSKYYAMTGWRLGWMVLPDRLLRSVECLAQNLFICPSALSQHAALAVFDCRETLDAHVARYGRNRAVLLRELPRAGICRFAAPNGAFYLYADVGTLTDDSQAFCRRMLHETGVAITPGIDFDPVRGHRFVRFSFAGPENDIAEAARRLVAWLG
ncbi:MAG: aminotransferase class I/II-fold pyridoxal phosphate-dependent enzyme [Rhodospirillales bacterium]|nr:MAG: aminotransferase class I/II-fold pyridoxal phosphate-dependent enzyme [Rhodospirillales bacterium]